MAEMYTQCPQPNNSTCTESAHTKGLMVGITKCAWNQTLEDEEFSCYFVREESSGFCVTNLEGTRQS